MAIRHSQHPAVPPGAGDVLAGSEAQTGEQCQTTETPVVLARRRQRAHGWCDPGVAATALQDAAHLFEGKEPMARTFP